MSKVRSNQKQLLSRSLVTVALVASLAGCSGGGSATSDQPNGGGATGTQPAKSAAPDALALGVPFEVKQNKGTAKITIKSATYGPTTGSDFESPAKNGGYLILDVLWESAEGIATSNPFYINAKSADGRKGDFAIGVPNDLGTGDIPVGDKSAGNVGFDIGARPYVITVTNQILQEKARLTVTATPRP